MRLTAREIANRAGGEVAAGDPDAVVSSWAFDSRALDPGACFVALAGHRDGHDFVGAALRAGARAALVQHVPPAIEVPSGHAIVRVADVIGSLQSVARFARATRADLRVVAVTGSTGKTSTKDLLAAALPPGSVYASPESYNNEFGLPITLLNAPAPVRGIIAEMGERFPGDIALLCDIARPSTGVVTNVGLAHAEHLGGPEGVAAVLAEMLEALPHTGTAVLNADDAWTERLAAHTSARVETVGYSADADHRITEVHLDASLQPEFSLHDTRFRIGLRGEHQILNAALAAVTAARAFDASWVDIALGMKDARGSRWRMELLETRDGVVLLNDSYNANPSSMGAALRALAHLDVDGRRIAVLGDMRELGDHSAGEHEAVGRLAGEVGIDVLIGVGAGGAQIVDAAAVGVGLVRRAADAGAAAAMVTELARPGDAVLVKASRAIGLQIVAERLVHREPVQ